MTTRRQPWAAVPDEHPLVKQGRKRFAGPKEAVIRFVEDEAANEFGGRKKWVKDGVRNAQNNKYILKCVRDIYNERRS